MQQAEVSEGMLGFLGCRFAEQFGKLVVAQLLGHIGKEEVFAVGHALAAEGGFEVGASRVVLSHRQIQKRCYRQA